MKSWRTSLGGVGMILGAIAKFAEDVSNGKPPDFATIVPLIIGGVSFFFAKDSRVTGGTIQQ